MDSPLSEAEQSACVSRTFWKLMPVLWLSAVLSYLDRSNLSFAALQLNADMGMLHYI